MGHFTHKTLLITGGTGSFGNAVLELSYVREELAAWNGNQAQ